MHVFGLARSEFFCFDSVTVHLQFRLPQVLHQYSKVNYKRLRYTSHYAGINVSAASLFRELPDFRQKLSELMLPSAAKQQIGAESPYSEVKTKMRGPCEPRTIFVS